MQQQRLYYWTLVKYIYHCLPHNLTAKLTAYCFDRMDLSLIADYLTNRLQRLKIDSSFSLYIQILRIILQELILRPVLLNLFVNDFMFFISETKVCNFVDDTTVYSCPLTHFRPMPDLCRRSASLLRMSLFHRCFSNILLVKTNYLVCRHMGHWSKMV